MTSRDDKCLHGLLYLGEGVVMDDFLARCPENALNQGADDPRAVLPVSAVDHGGHVVGNTEQLQR